MFAAQSADRPLLEDLPLPFTCPLMSETLRQMALPVSRCRTPVLMIDATNADVHPPVAPNTVLLAPVHIVAVKDVRDPSSKIMFTMCVEFRRRRSIDPRRDPLTTIFVDRPRPPRPALALLCGSSASLICRCRDRTIPENDADPDDGTLKGSKPFPSPGLVCSRPGTYWVSARTFCQGCEPSNTITLRFNVTNPPVATNYAEAMPLIPASTPTHADAVAVLEKPSAAVALAQGPMNTVGTSAVDLDQQIPHKASASAEFNQEDLLKYIHLPEKQAAVACRMCATKFKRMARKAGISRWPYRRVAALLRELRPDHPEEVR